MYYVFLDTDVTVRGIVPGVLVAAIGLTAFQAAFRLYTQVKSPESSVVAGILILLTWLYFSGLVVLLGAVCNAVLSNRSRDVSIEPVIGGIDSGHDERINETREHLVASLRELDANLANGSELHVTGAIPTYASRLPGEWKSTPTARS